MNPPITRQRVHQIIVDALDDMVREPVEQLRRMELQRLDAMQVRVYQAAIKGNCSAIDRVLKIQKRRARLLGLDVPTVQKHEITEDAA